MLPTSGSTATCTGCLLPCKNTPFQCSRARGAVGPTVTGAAVFVESKEATWPRNSRSCGSIKRGDERGTRPLGSTAPGAAVVVEPAGFYGLALGCWLSTGVVTLRCILYVIIVIIIFVSGRRLQIPAAPDQFGCSQHNILEGRVPRRRRHHRSRPSRSHCHHLHHHRCSQGWMDGWMVIGVDFKTVFAPPPIHFAITINTPVVMCAVVVIFVVAVSQPLSQQPASQPVS